MKLRRFFKEPIPWPLGPLVVFVLVPAFVPLMMPHGRHQSVEYGFWVAGTICLIARWIRAYFVGAPRADLIVYVFLFLLMPYLAAFLVSLILEWVVEPIYQGDGFWIWPAP